MAAQGIWVDTIRRVAHDDIGLVTRTLGSVRRRTMRGSGADLAQSCVAGSGALAFDGDQCAGLLLASPPHLGSAWIRALALADDAQQTPTIAALTRAVCQPVLGISSLRYSADSNSIGWLIAALDGAGFGHETDILAYEKRRFDIPTLGDERVTLRAATAADLPLLLAFDEQCFTPEWHKPPEQLAAYLAEHTTVMIAEREAVPVGYTLTTIHYEGQLQHLLRIAVVPGAQGCGVGARLLADVVQRARARRAIELTLNTQAYNTRARRLYEWFGFRQTGERQRIWVYSP
jgi:ribosomal protein S18 acetylase RimI-like enzyme